MDEGIDVELTGIGAELAGIDLGDERRGGMAKVMLGAMLAALGKHVPLSGRRCVPLAVALARHCSGFGTEAAVGKSTGEPDEKRLPPGALLQENAHAHPER